jgi:hypothetical protein
MAHLRWLVKILVITSSLQSFAGLTPSSSQAIANLEKECADPSQQTKFEALQKRFSSLPANPVNTQMFSIEVPLPMAQANTPTESPSMQSPPQTAKVVLQILTNGQNENYQTETCSLITYSMMDSMEQNPSQTKICCRLENGFGENSNPFDIFGQDP